MNLLARLDALMALHKQSSPGPWKTEQDWTHELLDANGMLIGKLVANAGPYDRFIDAKLVIETANSLPAIAAECRRMREALQAVVEAGHENGNFCNTQLAYGQPCDCVVALAEDALRGAK